MSDLHFQDEPADPAGYLPYPEPGGEEFTQGHSGTDTSRDRARGEAADGTARVRQSRVLNFARLRGSTGLTVKELREDTGWHHGQASSTLSVLHKAGRLARLTETRDRCKVYVLPERVHGRVAEPFGRRTPEQSEAERFDDAYAKAADPERYEELRRLSYEERHPCPVEDCNISSEEHHRLSFGVIAELRELRRRVAEYERGMTYSLAEVRDGTGWERGVRFRMVRDERP